MSNNRGITRNEMHQSVIDELNGYSNGLGNLSKSNVASMKSANVSVGQYVKTLGYYSAGDGGGASYVIVASGTGTDDGGSLITLNNGLQAQLIEESYNNVKQFGAYGDGVHDDSQAIINNSAWGGRLGYKIYCPQGKYYITQKITISNRHLTGDGWYRTYFLFDTNGQLYLTGTRNTVEGIDFGSFNATNANIGIELACTHSVIRDCTAHNFNNAIQIDANSWSNTFIKVDTYYNDIAFTLNGDQINNTSFYHCHAVNNRIGFNCLSGDTGFHYKVSFYSCHTELNSDAGMYISANGTYSLHGCYFERNNTTNQTGLDKGGLVVSYPNASGPRPTIDLVGCYHLQSNIRIKQSGTTTTTLISNSFKSITSGYAIELLNGDVTTTSKVLNINPYYESVTTRTNLNNCVYDLNSNNMEGTTVNRPTSPTTGQSFFDKNLYKPIWWDSVRWRDAENVIPENRGINVSVNASVTTYTASFASQENNLNYSVFVSPTWNTTYWITNKTANGFTINFGTAPGSTSTLDWKITR